MALRESFYCAVFLGLLFYAEALDCYTQTSCSGPGCGGAAVSTDLEETTCQSPLNACLKVTSELTVDGDKAKTTTLSCSANFGLGNGCSSLDDLPPSVAAAYESFGFDSFEYCLCDQELCNGSMKATYTLSAVVGSFLVTLGAIFLQV